MSRIASLTFALFVVTCGGSGGRPSNGAPSDAGTGAPSPTPGTGSDGGGGAFGGVCDSEYTDGCSSIPGPGAAACGGDPVHCCQTRRRCATGLTCVGATCSIECSTATDCKAITPTATCVFVFSTSTLKGRFEPCPDSGSCPGGLVCRQTTPLTMCEQYMM